MLSMSQALTPLQGTIFSPSHHLELHITMHKVILIDGRRVAVKSLMIKSFVHQCPYIL